MPAETTIPSYNLPQQGNLGQQAIPTYPVNSGHTDPSQNGGLPDLAGSALSGVQNGMNLANQAQLMHRATQNYNEQQTANQHLAKDQQKPGPDPAIPPPAQGSGNGALDFFHGIANSSAGQAVMAGVHAIGNFLQGDLKNSPAIPPPNSGTDSAPPMGVNPDAGPPRPTAPAAPAPMASPDVEAKMNGGPIRGYQDGGVVDNGSGTPIHKATGWELAKTAVGELGHALFDSGAAVRAANAAHDSVTNAGPQADVESKMAGGVIGKPSHAGIPPQHGGGFGVSSSGNMGVRGYEGGGNIQPTGPSVPDTAGAAQAGVANGQDLAQQSQQMDRASTQYGQDQKANAAAAGAASGPANPDAMLAQKVHELGTDLQSHELDKNTAGVPTPEQALQQASAPGATQPQGDQDPKMQASRVAADPGAAPTQGSQPSPVQSAQTAQAVQGAVQSPAAQQGDPGVTPAQAGKPHSLAYEVWDKWDKQIDDAAYYAALAGRDPGQVRAALDANRNAWVQGHVMRYLSTANAAVLNGEPDKAAEALRNAYYYFPDGQELKVAKDPKLGLVYQDPVNPFITDKDGNKILKDGKPQPNMIPVDAAHIQMVGQALLDPMKLQTTITNLRSSAATINKENLQGQGAYLTGEGNFLRGRGIDKGADVKATESAGEIYKNFGEGQRARAQAAYLTERTKQAAMGKDGKVDGQLQKLGMEAAQEYDNVALGRPTVVPTQVPQIGKDGKPVVDKNGNVVMQPNMDPNAGKTTRDTSKVPEALKNLTPEQHVGNKALASEIAIANRGLITPQRAAALAAMIQAQRNTKHKGADGKDVPDVLIDKGQNTGHVYDKQTGQTIDFHLTPNAATSMSTGDGSASPLDLVAMASGPAGVPSEGSNSEATGPDYTSPG